MNYFEYRNDQLFAEDVPIADLARQINTPFFVYSARTLRRHFRVFDEAFAGTDHLICYAMKALSNLSILKLFDSMGAGFDIVSVGELMRCLRVGADPRKIVFSGVGKTDEEIAAALKAGILMINVESRPELHRIAEVAGRMKHRAPVSLRVNPDLDPGTHPHISTGHRDSKFGVPLSQVDEYYAEASALAQLEIVGLSTHIGSQITEMAPFAEAGQKVAAIVGRLRSAGIDAKVSRSRRRTRNPLPGAAAASIGICACAAEADRWSRAQDNHRARTRDGRQRGRSGDEGPLQQGDRREALCRDRRRDERSDSSGTLRGVSRDRSCRSSASSGKTVTADIVGPVCESGDFFAREREMAEPEEGDLLAVMSAGAYGFVMSSNYNSRPRAPELLIDGADVHVIRDRDSFEDQIRGEHIVSLKTA